MKYIIDIPNEDVGRWVIGTPYGLRLCVPLSIEDGGEYHIKTEIPAEPYTEPDRKAIEDEVWELADYMCKMSPTERTLCFAFEYPSEVTANFTYQEAKSLFEKWMKSENEIHVGDEVVVNGLRGVVMKLDEKGNVDRYFTSDGKTFGNITGFLNNEVKKTGRHFPEVAELLEKMRGGTE